MLQYYILLVTVIFSFLQWHIVRNESYFLSRKEYAAEISRVYTFRRRGGTQKN